MNQIGGTRVIKLPDWKGIIEMIYVLLILVSVIAVFFGLYPTWGVTNASVLTLVVALLEAIFGYILFEKIIE